MVNQTEAIAPPPPLTRRARTKRLFGQLRLLDTLRRDKIGAIGAVLVVVMTSLALFAPWVAPFDPLAMSSGNRLVSPSTTFLLGSDEAGRDLLSRALYGARTSLVVSLTVVIIAGLVGVTLG